MKLHFHNDHHSPIEDRFARTTVEWILSDLKLRRPVHFFLQGFLTDMDDQGFPMPNTGIPNFGHDGDAYNSGVCRVAIGKNVYPEEWGVNPACGKGYLNNIFEFGDAYELFTFLAAHELRHQWQWEKPEKIKQIRKLLKCNDETDADIYAARMLSYYKSQ